MSQYEVGTKKTPTRNCLRGGHGERAGQNRDTQKNPAKQGPTQAKMLDRGGGRELVRGGIKQFFAWEINLESR